ncbi:hypothetical protein PAECIP112173_03474 [Paenibacillus sp. JJ-100]|uniref:hypothetical protein n=1 Tax=Paenibacillus sp. JJ-100 TaxID=2974896 RepID=UPI0022FFA84F|nr:hypothetical protein [Paenibacillus sp. JJ-100]CAI6082188.1 hypothetical protein PAECIP112173_03474 [Paenibacillus sp. JJ-100]
MRYLLTALFILGLIVFFGFLGRMILSMRKQNKVSIRHVLLTMASFAISVIGMYGMLAFPSADPHSGTEQTAVHRSDDDITDNDLTDERMPPRSQTELLSLNLTTDEFKNRFNIAVGKYRLNGLSITHLNRIEPRAQETGSFEYVFNEELRLVGVLNADEHVQEIRLYRTGDTTEPTGGMQLTAIAALILATNSEYTYNDVQDVLQEIGLLDRDVNQLDFDGKTVRNGLEYRFSIQDRNHSTFEITAVK